MLGLKSIHASKKANGIALMEQQQADSGQEWLKNEEEWLWK